LLFAECRQFLAQLGQRPPFVAQSWLHEPEILAVGLVTISDVLHRTLYTTRPPRLKRTGKRPGVCRPDRRVPPVA
jgi:hypothetical protein